MTDESEPAKRRFRLPDFTRPEIRVAAVLFVNNFLLLCSFTMIKPVRNAIILDRLGPAWLPVGFIGAALATGLAVSMAGWLAARAARSVPDREDGPG